MSTALASAPGSPIGVPIDPVSFPDGTNTSPSAPVITPTFSGTASQLADTSRDYEVYLTVTTAGTATTVSMGPTSSANAVTLMSSTTATLGEVIGFRLPAGWFVKASGTSTVFSQAAVGC